MSASTRHHPFHNTLQRVWDVGTLDWLPMTQPGGSSGGGGDASAANQVTGNASLAAIKLDVDKIPSQGQALAAASLPVVLTAIQVAALTPLTTVAVTGTFWQATQPVSGTFWQSTQPVSIASMPSTPVTGTFWQATQPVSLATAPTTPVTGTFWQATQPVSGTVTATGPLTDTQLRASAVPVTLTSTTVTGSVAVTGTFFQATQPVSGTVTANAGTNLNTSALNLETSQAAMSAKLPATLGQKAMTASMAVVLASDQTPLSIQHGLTGATNIFKTATITTTATTADQVVLTYTVTSAKTFYLQYIIMYGRLTVAAATATILGAISLETPSGTKAITFDDMNPTTSELEFNSLTFTEPIPIAAGVVIRVVVTPAAITSMLWRANFGGYEK